MADPPGAGDTNRLGDVIAQVVGRDDRQGNFSSVKGHRGVAPAIGQLSHDLHVRVIVFDSVRTVLGRHQLKADPTLVGRDNRYAQLELGHGLFRRPLADRLE